MDLLEIFSDSEDLVGFPAGSVIITEGQEGDLMYVVMDGEAVISLKEKELATAGPGEIIGEMALINSEIRSATVTARTDCTLAQIDQKSFESLLRYVPDFSIHVMNVLASRLQTAYDLIE
jgi:CRP-like cAMP-binding protein